MTLQRKVFYRPASANLKLRLDRQRANPDHCFTDDTIGQRNEDTQMDITELFDITPADLMALAEFFEF